MLRVSDVMRREFPQAGDGEPVREVGRLMAREDLDLVPIVDGDGALAGVMTERSLARRYIRDSREPSELRRADQRSARSPRVLQGQMVCGDEHAEVSGQIWCLAMDVGVAAGRDRLGRRRRGRQPRRRAAARRSSSASACSSPATELAPIDELWRSHRERGVVVVALAAGQLRDRRG